MKNYVEIVCKEWKRGSGWDFEDIVDSFEDITLDEINEELHWWTFETNSYFSEIHDIETQRKEYEPRYYYFHDSDYKYIARVYSVDENGNPDYDTVDEIDNGCWVSEGYQIWMGGRDNG